MTRTCPYCGEELGDATPESGPDAKPEAGNVSVCFYCGGFLFHTSPDEVRILSLQEYAKLPASMRKELCEVSARVRKFQFNRMLSHAS